MEKEQVKFFIRQAIDQLEAELESIDASDGSYDLALGSSLTTALNYIFAAWQFRNVPPEELGQIPQDEYESIIFKFPSDIDPRFTK